MLLIADGITRRRHLKADRCSNVSGENLVQLCPLVGVHLQDTADTFLLVLRRIQYIGTCLHGTGIDTEEGQLPDKGIRHNLKGKSGERFFIRRVSHNFFSVQIHTVDWRNVKRRRKKFHYRIEQLLHTLVPVSRAATNRYRRAFTGSLAQGLFQIFHGDFLSVQKLLGQFIIQFADLLYHFVMVFLCQILQVLRHILDQDIVSLIAAEEIGLHFE